MIKGLYVHIPFCKTRCHYCHFITAGDPSPGLRARWQDSVFKEIRHAREIYGALEFETLYLGGGTPSILRTEEIARLLGALRENFRIRESAEITCEWNPGDAEKAKLSALRRSGINRISLGAQAFQDSLLGRLGRRHTVRDTIQTLEKIRDAGISNISLDLMLRLPGQTPADFRNSLEQCIVLKASQVSLYDLEVHEDTEFGRLRKQEALALPPEEEHSEMYKNAIDLLTAAGYEHYEISNFSMPGFASRHNLIYWRNQEYLGLGPGAFSYLGGLRYQFASDSDRYLRKCAAGDWTNDTQDLLSSRDKALETFVTGLRLKEGIRADAFRSFFPGSSERIATLCKEGLLESTGENLRLARRGQFLCEDVFHFLLQDLSVGTGLAKPLS